MDFELGEELVALRDIARDLLGQRWKAESARRALDAPPSRMSGELWAELAEMGWFGAGCSEAAGGSGLGVIGAALLAEEAGRALLPGAMTSTLAGAVALDRNGGAALKAELLPQIIAGTLPVTLAVEEPNGTWGPDSVEVAGQAGAGGLKLSGTKIFVADGSTARLFLVAARVGDDVRLLPVEAGAGGVEVVPMQRIDAQDIVELRLDGVQVGVERMVPDAGAAHDAYAVWTVLVAADLLGSAGAALAMTTAYAKERMQFGRPIGSFQAVSHRLADVQVNVEIGRSLLYAACLALDERRGDAGALVAAAKAFIGETAVDAAEAAVQLHGGIGYTWELDVHLHLRRARANAVTAGDAGWHRETVARHMAHCYA